MPEALRVYDPETARVVVILSSDEHLHGAGCLLSKTHILTCYHVVKSAVVPDLPIIGSVLKAKIIGLAEAQIVEVEVLQLGSDRLTDDITLLKIRSPLDIAMAPTEFRTPLRHSGKAYSVLGFPSAHNSYQGRTAVGHLSASDAIGLVQMDHVGSDVIVQGGFSGAPVWCPEAGGFVGMVVIEQHGNRLAWCIPSRFLCKFYKDLPVRFHIPIADRPKVHDYAEDDPNTQFFGTVSTNDERRLTALVTEENDDEEEEYFRVIARYEVIKGEPRGTYVTFITYPDFTSDEEDAYELYAKLDHGIATVEFYPIEGFTIAAIGDAGDTALTLDLCSLPNNPPAFSNAEEKKPIEKSSKKSRASKESKRKS